MAKLLHVAALMAIGLPVVSLLTLLGGVAPQAIGLAYGGTASTALFLAALAVAVSSVSKRVRDAILAAYLLALLWLVLPMLVTGPIRSGWPIIYSVAGRPFEWVMATNPFWLLGTAVFPGPGSIATRFAVMVGAQVAVSVALIGLATARLRPSFRNEGGRRRGRGRGGAAVGIRRPGRRHRRRPAIADDPMLWKERHVARLGTVTRIAAVLVGLMIYVGIGYGTAVMGRPALLELIEGGYGDVTAYGPRDQFNGLARTLGALLYCLVGLGVAVAAAGAVSSERDQDTWTSLISTDLTGEEILRAKLFGAVWGVRWFVPPLAMLWTVALLTGSLHPFGYIASWVALAIFVWFAASLGLFFSLTTRNATRALAWTVGTLIVLNGGYLMVILWFYDDSPMVALGCSPFILGIVGVSIREVWLLSGLLDSHSFGLLGGPKVGEMIATCLIGMTAYLAAAASLTAYCFHAFDRLIDRPSRPIGRARIADDRPASADLEPADLGEAGHPAAR